MEFHESVYSGLGSELCLPFKPGPRHLFVSWLFVHLFMQQGMDSELSLQDLNPALPFTSSVTLGQLLCFVSYLPLV